jgi:hypothetical protein
VVNGAAQDANLVNFDLADRDTERAVIMRGDTEQRGNAATRTEQRVMASARQAILVIGQDYKVIGGHCQDELPG